MLTLTVHCFILIQTINIKPHTTQCRMGLLKHIINLLGEGGQMFMLKYFKGLMEFPLKFIPLAVCATILATALSIYITTYQTYDLREMTSRIRTDTQEIKWDAIEHMLQKEYLIAKKETETLAVTLEQALRSNYPNLDVLEEQFNNKVYSEELNQIFRSVITVSHDENRTSLVMVGTRDHLISIHANTDRHLFSLIDTSKNISWLELASLTPNEVLTKNAIQSVLTRYNKIIFTASDPNVMHAARTRTVPSIDSLQMIYDQEGVEGLKGLTLLAPAYITKEGDIFGTDDRTFLKNNNNHKLIIVKTINVEELLDENKLFMDSITDTIKTLSDTANSQGERSVIQAISWSFTLFMLSLFMIAVYNSEARKGNLRSEERG